MTIYELEFLSSARKEWDKLGATIRDQFVRNLGERLTAPVVASARLHGLDDCYKIKLRAAGYRLVYRVEETRLVVLLVAVGRRDRNLVYKLAAGRLD